MASAPGKCLVHIIVVPYIYIYIYIYMYRDYVHVVSIIYGHTEATALKYTVNAFFHLQYSTCMIYIMFTQHLTLHFCNQLAETPPVNVVGGEEVEGGDNKTTSTAAYGNIEAVEMTAEGAAVHMHVHSLYLFLGLHTLITVQVSL